MPSLFEAFPEDARKLLTATGSEIIERLGIDVIREVVGDVLLGGNVRNATEQLTRRRLTILNAGLVVSFLEAALANPGLDDLLDEARERYQSSEVSKEERQFLRWVLGLTGKQVDNVLRNDPDAWLGYVEGTKEILIEVADSLPDLSGVEGCGESGWDFFLKLGMAIGAQTLAIRGSEKSVYGKLFERFVLTGALHSLGFSLADGPTLDEDSFWLSERGNRRESDATAYHRGSIVVRFDLGFIGKGNPEISLDKVSRFGRVEEILGERRYVRTVILVDRIGKKSRIRVLAQEIEGMIIEMSDPAWLRELGDGLAEVFPDYSSPLLEIQNQTEYEAFVRGALESAPFGRLVEG